MAMGIHFENFGSLRAPVPGLKVILGIYRELVQKILDITFTLDGHKSSLEFLSEVQILVSVSLA